MYLLHKYLLGTCYVLGTVVDTGYGVVNNTDLISSLIERAV